MKTPAICLLTLAAELSMHPLQAHCRLGLRTLYTTSDQPQQARTALSTATEMYRAMTLWLSQAEAAQIGEAVRPAGRVP